MQVRNAVFRALADPTRREILRLLRSAPRTSGEIAAQFDSSWPTVSRHLSVLKEAGLVVYHVVPTLLAALKAVDAGVDGLVVEGGEGGGFKSPIMSSPKYVMPRWPVRWNN